MTGNGLDSLSEFRDSLKEVETLLALNPARPLNKSASVSSQERETANAITRSCTVMLVSHFEGFVKSGLTELIDEICRAKPPARRLPEGLLELHTRERIQEIFGTEGPERITRTRRLFATYSSLWEEDRSINPQVLSAKILARQFTSAKPEVLSSVFSLLGVSDIMDELDTRVNQAIVNRGDQATSVRVHIKLTEIVDRRNKISHGDRNEKPTPVEVESYMTFLTDVADCLASVLEARISHCCSLR
ncbi:MAE_28990/MAE_18760 family HEPN-like nuclease [Streptomyces wedmorensis]|uniref:MAE_28990/MAE_18760 family HEPN-like nuclease n=1 Tax=Streptomyces wedmorensis TaxID=43759 RepID=UPI0034486437